MGVYTIPSSPAATGNVSSLNSSTTAIDTGDSFVGTWEDVGGANSLVVSVSTDQDGYYEVQFSPDGTNADSTLTRYYRTDQINVPHRFTIARQFFRVRFFNNSGTNQTYFRLQVLVGEKADLNIPVDSTMSQDYDAISVRPTGFTEEVALGRRQGYSTWNKFGYNTDVDTAATEIVAEFGGAFNQKLSSGETLNIVSSSTQDASGGTGATQLVIFGVDSNWDLVTEVITPTGTSTATTTNSFLGINRMTIFTSGSSDSNVGTITATASSSGNTMATMPAGQGTTQQLLFYVPRDHQFLTTWLYLSAIKSSGGGNPEVTFFGQVYSSVVDSTFEVYRDTLDTQIESRVTLAPTEPFVIGEKSILWFEASTSSNNTSVRGRFSGKLIRDVDA